MIEGIKMNLGGEDYIVPPLNFRQLREFKTEIEKMQNLTNSNDPMGDLAIAVPVIAAALKRNYPDLDVDKVTEMLDMGNYMHVFEAILGITPELRDLLNTRLAQIKLGEARPLPTRAQ